MIAGAGGQHGSGLLLVSDLVAGEKLAELLNASQEEENGDMKLTNDDKHNKMYELTNTEITFIHVKITASSFTFSARHISLHL